MPYKAKDKYVNKKVSHTKGSIKNYFSELHTNIKESFISFDHYYLIINEAIRFNEDLPAECPYGFWIRYDMALVVGYQNHYGIAKVIIPKEEQESSTLSTYDKMYKKGFVRCVKIGTNTFHIEYAPNVTNRHTLKTAKDIGIFYGLTPVVTVDNDTIFK